MQAYSSPLLALRHGSVRISCLDTGGYPEFGRATRRAEDLVGDSGAAIESSGLIRIS